MKELTNIKERIKYYIDNQNIKKSHFYKQTGVSYGILCQPSKMSEDNIVKILTSYPEINPDWLLLGNGEMLKKDEEKEITDPVTYEKLLDEIKELLQANNEYLLTEIKRLNKKNTAYKPYAEQDFPINLVADDDQQEKFQKTKKKEK